MKKQTLLLFYFVPWLPLEAKVLLYLDQFDLPWVAVAAVFGTGLYMAVFCGLAFQWGKGRLFWPWILGTGIQYGVNHWSAKPLLGDAGGMMDDIWRLLQFLSAFLQMGLYLAGRREKIMEEKS